MSSRRMPQGLLACALLALLAPVAAGGVTIASPLRPAPVASRGPVTPLVLDAQAYEVVRGLAEVTLTGFPLGAGGPVALDLQRREIFSNDAVILRGDQVLPRPDIVLLTGHVVGDPDSLVVLGLSPRATNGSIEHIGETFVISSGRPGRSRDDARLVGRLPIRRLRG